MLGGSDLHGPRSDGRGVVRGGLSRCPVSDAAREMCNGVAEQT